MRIIGIRHRVKKTAEGEARPTQVAILENGKIVNLQLETETDELDFVLGNFPTSFRKLEGTWGDITDHLLRLHHVKWRKLKEGEDPDEFHQSRIRKDGKTVEVAVQVPASYEGLRPGDKVAMILGGSGDNLAFALARRGQDIGASVHRLPPFVFQKVREKPSDEDARLLATTLSESPALFYEVGPRDLSLIWLRECLRSRVDAMKARIACEQRLRQHMIGAIFCQPSGLFPEGDIEKEFDRAKANDKIYQALVSEEAKRERELTKACEALDVYSELFKPIEGLGPMIASRIIGAVIDIRRFSTKAKLRAFCGVHIQVLWKCLDCKKNSCIEDWKSDPPEIPQCFHCESTNVEEVCNFPRKRSGKVANWSGDCRQALYLFGDQMNRRPNSYWGQRLVAAKLKYRTSHPYPVLVTKDGSRYELRDGEYTKTGDGTYTVTIHDNGDTLDITGLRGTLRYTNGHIHKMAIWYTLGKFIEWLFKDWKKLEKASAGHKRAAA